MEKGIVLVQLMYDLTCFNVKICLTSDMRDSLVIVDLAWSL